VSAGRGWLRRVLWDHSAIGLRQGRWGFWWTSFATAAMVGVTVAVAAAIYFPLDRFHASGSADEVLWLAAAEPNVSVLLGNPYSLVGFVVVGIAFVLPVLAAAWIQGHRATDFLVLHGDYSWSRFWRSGGALIATTLPFVPLMVIYFGSAAEWSFASFRYPLFVCATLAVIAIQTFAEEAMFRGYLYHAWLRVIPSPALVAVFWSAVFSALHWFNPDVQRDPVTGMIGLMAFALFAQWLTVRTGNLDAAWGLHFVNNVFVTFGVNILPGYTTDAAMLQFTDKALAVGGSYALEPTFYVWMVSGYGLQFAAVLHPRSPFYIAPRSVDRADADKA
jgi:uncharacterized protein